MVAGNSASKGRIKSAIAAKTIVTASEAANVMRGPVAVFLLNCLAQLDEYSFVVGARRALVGTVRRFSNLITISKPGTAVRHPLDATYGRSALPPKADVRGSK